MQQLEEPQRGHLEERVRGEAGVLCPSRVCVLAATHLCSLTACTKTRVLLDTIPGQCIFSSGSSMLSQGRGDPWVGNQSSQAGPGEPQEPQAGCFRLSRTDTPTLHITEGRSSGCTRPRARMLLPNHAAPEGSVARKGTALPLGGK